MCVHLPFDYKKATQALNYFAQRSGGVINRMKALKLIFFADRYHLRKYGQPITNDEYFAMKLGPVPSGVKDIAQLDHNFGPDSEISKYISDFLAPQGRYELLSKLDCDLREFSESNLESLEFAWDKFGEVEPFQLADYTHNYPEWKRHEEALKFSARARMRIEDFLADPEEADPCFVLSEEEKAIRLEELEEMSRMAALWS